MLEKLLEVLTRIAVAVEKIAGQSSKDAVPAAPKADKKTAAPVQEVAKPVVEDVDPFATEPAAPAVTLESLTDVLKKHSIALGTKTTIALIKNHGADQVTPKINTIPAVNYQACFDEVTADLKKFGAKK